MGQFSVSVYMLGNPVFTGGDVLVESVYRFKGQAAPCVIFTEIDFEALDDLAMRKLFVGVTRATIKLTMILSERSAQMLIERLSDNDSIV